MCCVTCFCTCRSCYRVCINVFVLNKLDLEDVVVITGNTKVVCTCYRDNEFSITLTVLNCFLSCFGENYAILIHKSEVSSVAACYVPDLDDVRAISCDLKSILGRNGACRCLTTEAESECTFKVIPSLRACINSGVLTHNECEYVVKLECITVSVCFLSEFRPLAEVDDVRIVVRINCFTSCTYTTDVVVMSKSCNCFLALCICTS